MKFEFSRSFLMGLAVAGLLTSCGGSGSWVDSPDDWAQAPMPGAVAAPANPEKAPETPAVAEAPVVADAPAVAQAAPTQAAVEEAPAEPKKWNWWKKEQNAEEVSAPEVANDEPVAAPVAQAPMEAAPAAAPTEEKQKRSLWDVMTGKNKASAEELAVAPSAPDQMPEPQVGEASPEVAPAVKSSGDFPTAERVKYMNGWVYSPYDSRKINVRGVSSGSLVADPRYPLDQKKYFRVP